MGLEEIKRIIKNESNLLNILKKVQDTRGYLSEDTLSFISKELDIPLAKLYGAVSFYSFLKLKRGGKHTIRVCNSPSCYLNGSANVLKIVEEFTGLKAGECNDDFSFELTSCIGCCDEAPAMMVDDEIFTSLNEKEIKKILEKLSRR
jgi:NADH-quinone oxidoreductase subunit E